MVRYLFLILFISARALHAAPELCERAAHLAARETGVPEDILQAIALAESGRSQDGVLRPWPWTANIAGQGHWLESEAALRALVEGALAAGQRQVDIGCFQINWFWHGAEFREPAALIDPVTGARYAARYLLTLATRYGSLEAAIAAYHSRDAARGARYAARVAALRARSTDIGHRATSLASEAPSERMFLSTSLGGATGSLAHPITRVRPFIAGLRP